MTLRVGLWAFLPRAFILNLNLKVKLVPFRFYDRSSMFLFLLLRFDPFNLLLVLLEGLLCRLHYTIEIERYSKGQVVAVSFRAYLFAHVCSRL